MGEQHDTEPLPHNNMAAVRRRAELFADRMVRHRLTPLQTGYVAESLALQEAARQIRVVAALGLTEQQLLIVADRLDAVADDTILLGRIQTENDG